jgi:hypothetical protein
MGNNFQSIKKINFEDIQYIINSNPNEIYILINTLSENEQRCLIKHTMEIHKETDLINKFLKTGNKQIKIIIYGKNCNDEKIFEKYKQLTSLGFYNVYIYIGGIFEWLLLQDIYGEKEFPTTNKELDLLKYKPSSLIFTKENNYSLISF